ncbi:MAG: GspMb/PilO family protein [Patescibacteria group bacterium]
MIRVSLKKKAIALVIISALLTLVIVILIIFPAVKRIRNLDGFISASEEEIEGSFQKTTRLKSSVKKLSETIREIGELGDMTSDKSSELELITMFEELADQNNVTQNLNMQFSGSEQIKKKNAGLKDGGYYLFSQKITGRYPNLLAYLRSMEDMRYYLIVDDLNIRKNTEDSRAADAMTMNLTIKIYSK